jgi:hypothetical protein
MLHGFLAAAAVTLLLYAAATIGLPSMAFTALVLIIAVLGFLLLLVATWRA